VSCMPGWIPPFREHLHRADREGNNEASIREAGKGKGEPGPSFVLQFISLQIIPIGIFNRYRQVAMRKADYTKRYIIEKVAPVFNMNGYAGTSMSQLTDAVGLTKGALYGNFKNKDEIALAALEFNISRISYKIADTVKPIKNNCDKLVAFAQFYMEAFDSVSQTGGCPILNAAIDSDNSELPLREVVIRSLENWMNSISMIIKKGIKKNEIKEGVNPDAFATYFVSLIEGGIMLSKVTGSRIHLERNVSCLVGRINDELRE
jgi:TetR/AcrR family transcriptional regulator, transcriptional repressor for nem operon